MTAIKIKANFEFFSKKVRAKQKKHAKTDKFKILASLRAGASAMPCERELLGRNPIAIAENGCLDGLATSLWESGIAASAAARTSNWSWVDNPTRLARRSSRK